MPSQIKQMVAVLGEAAKLGSSDTDVAHNAKYKQLLIVFQGLMTEEFDFIKQVNRSASNAAQAPRQSDLRKSLLARITNGDVKVT